MTDIANKLRKRWGKRYTDDRNWPLYNEQLVRRGEYWLDLEWVQGWHLEVDRMNEGKPGHPYVFPDSLIKLQAAWHAKRITYRMIEGITRALYQIAELPAFNDYSTANRRINGLDLALEPPEGGSLAVYCDGTGHQAIDGGEYLREKYGKKNRQWIQIVLLGDPVTKEPVSYEVNLRPSSEADSAMRQMDRLAERGKRITGFGGDGAFDDLSLWRYLEANHIRPAIKPDKNARTDSTSAERNLNAWYRNKYGYKKWAEKAHYGRRWIATEGIFSAVKRIFGEQLAAKSDIGLIQETKAKFWAYQRLKRYGEADR